MDTEYFCLQKLGLFIQRIEDVFHSTFPCFSCHLLLHKFYFWSHWHCIGRSWKYVLTLCFSHTVLYVIYSLSSLFLFFFLFFSILYKKSLLSLFPWVWNGTQIWLKILTSMIDLIFFLSLLIYFVFGGDNASQYKLYVT